MPGSLLFDKSVVTYVIIITQEYLQELPQFFSRAEGRDVPSSVEQQLAVAFPDPGQVVQQGEAGQEERQQGEPQGGEAEGNTSPAGALCPLPRALLGVRERGGLVSV